MTLRLISRAILSALALVAFAAATLLAIAYYVQFKDGERLLIDFGAGDNPAESSLLLVTGNADYVLQSCCPHSTTVINPATNPERSFRSFTVKASDTKVKGNYRSELRTRSNPVGSNVVYRADIFVPSDWITGEERVIALQWHGSKDLFLAEPGRTPPLEIAISNGKWEFQKSWDDRVRSDSSRRGNVEGIEALGSAALSKGKWSKFDIFTHWSTGKDGRIVIWLNGKKVLNHSGPNAHKDLIGPYLKAGVYIPGWGYREVETNISERTLLFDNIEVHQLNSKPVFTDIPRSFP